MSYDDLRHLADLQSDELPDEQPDWALLEIAEQNAPR